MNLVVSVFTSTRTSLLASNRFCVFLYDIYAVTEHTDIVSREQELMWSIQFQFFLILLNLPDGIRHILNSVQLVTVAFLYNYYSKFHHLCINARDDRFFPLLWQLFLSPNVINEFVGLRTLCITSCLSQFCRNFINTW